VLTLRLLAPLALASQTLGDDSFYFGDLHVHTGYSGDGGSSDVGHCAGPNGCGAFSEVFDDARANGLDFIALADHLNGFRAMSEPDWSTYLAAILTADDPEHGFVSIPGGEIWSDDPIGPLGHHTLLMWEDASTLASLTLEQARHGPTEQLVDCAELWQWADTLSSGFGAISLIPHHPATLDPNGIDWRCFDDRYAPSVEVYSRHGNSLEGGSEWDVPGAGVVSDGYAAVALDPERYGLAFGFVGGTDAHDTRPGVTCQTDGMIPEHLYGGGLTGVVLEAGAPFDRMAIRDAMIDRRTYATTGPTVPLELTWSADGTVLGGLGALLDVPNDAELQLDVRLPEADAPFVDAVIAVSPHGSWELPQQGADTWSTRISAADLEEWLYVRVQLDGSAYHSSPCEDGGDDALEYLWSSPSFITLVDPVDPDDTGPADDTGPPPQPPDDCAGCAASPGAGALAGALAFVLVRHRTSRAARQRA
jgi:hypothetical protein